MVRVGPRHMQSGSAQYSVLGRPPSGLHISPRADRDLVAVARDVITHESRFPNNRFVIQAQKRDVHVSPRVVGRLQALSEVYDITIGLKVAVEPYAYEFEPAREVARQMRMGALAANSSAEMDIETFMSRFSVPPSVMERIGDAYEAYNAVKGQSDDGKMRGAKRDFSIELDRTVDDLIGRAQRDKSELTDQERSFLLSIAVTPPDPFGFNIVVEDLTIATTVQVRKIFEALHDFDGLRRVAGGLRAGDYDRLRCLASLEAHEEFCREADRYENNLSGQVNPLHGVEDRVREYVEGYALGYGYDDFSRFRYRYTLQQLSVLTDSYDLMIPIVRGGLFAGGMAKFLGCDTRLIKIHAHERDTPTFRMLDEIKPGDVAGKRILFLDKDTVTGATIAEAVRRLSPMGPSAMGVYFTNDPADAPVCQPETIQRIEALGLEVYLPMSAELAPLFPIFNSLHERFQTPLGRLRTVTREFRSAFRENRHRDPKGTAALEEFLVEQEELFHAVNHFIPGMDSVRKGIVDRLEYMRSRYQDVSLMPAVFLSQHTLVLFEDMMKIEPSFPHTAAETLARARYMKAGMKRIEELGFTNEHIPHDYTASFHAAQQAVSEGYDIALIVGPEGFMYEPIFQDLGIPTVAINIPEVDYDGERSLESLDDLSRLAGKRVLVVEDDVRSGATLKKLLAELEGNSPDRLGLYLGTRVGFQMLENVPPQFEHTYVTGADPDAAIKSFFEYLAQHEVLYKQQLVHSRFKGK